MLMYRKSMFDRYYCIKTFSRSTTLEKMPRKVLFSSTILDHTDAERYVTCERFKNAASKANVDVTELRLLLCTLLMMTSVFFFFCDGPGILIRKTAKPCVHSM